MNYGFSYSNICVLGYSGRKYGLKDNDFFCVGVEGGGERVWDMGYIYFYKINTKGEN